MNETATPDQDLDDIRLELTRARAMLDQMKNQIRIFRYRQLYPDPRAEQAIANYQREEADYLKRLIDYNNRRARTSDTRAIMDMDTSYRRGEGYLTVNPEGYGIPDTETAE